MERLEARCAKLEILLRLLHPGTDIEALLSLNTSQQTVNPPPAPAEAPNPSADSPSHEDSEPESLSATQPGGYEWQELSASVESPGSLQDGMASLNADVSTVGYLGRSSGTDLLRTVQSLLRQRYQGNAGALNSFEEPVRFPRFSVDKSPKDAMCNWTPRPNSYSIESLVNAYFCYYNTSYPILHERLFWRRYRQITSMPENSPFHIVFFMVLAIGAFASDTGSDNADYPYFLAARAKLTFRMLETGTLEAVQALLLMANYLQKRDRPNTGHNFLGLALRMAMGLGLHMEASGKGDANTELNEMRRRVWWVLFMFDSGASITLGRPNGIKAQSVTTSFPLNLDDSLVDSPESPVPGVVEYPTSYTASIGQAQLAMIANQIFDRLLCKSTRAASRQSKLQFVRSFDEALLHWKASLPACFTSSDVPDWFQGPRAVVLWKGQNIRMLLYKEFLFHRREFGTETRLENDSEARICLSVAAETIECIQTFCGERDSIRYGISWYATYFLFQAVLVVLTAAIKSQLILSNDLERTASLLKQARSSLMRMESSNSSASKCLEILGGFEAALFPQPQSDTTAGSYTQSSHSPPHNEISYLQYGNTQGQSGLTSEVHQDGLGLNYAQQIGMQMPDRLSDPIDGTGELFEINWGLVNETSGFPGTRQELDYDCWAV